MSESLLADGNLPTYLQDETLARIIRVQEEHQGDPTAMLAQLEDHKTTAHRLEVLDITHNFEPSGRITGKRDLDRPPVVFHLPLGNSLDALQMLSVDAIARMMPEHRVIAFGNPSKPFSNSVRMSPIGVVATAYTGKLDQLNSPALRYLSDDTDTTEVFQTGFSLGANRAVNAAAISNKYGLLPDKVVAVDPAFPEALAEPTTMSHG